MNDDFWSSLSSQLFIFYSSWRNGLKVYSVTNTNTQVLYSTDITSYVRKHQWMYSTAINILTSCCLHVKATCRDCQAHIRERTLRAVPRSGDTGVHWPGHPQRGHNRPQDRTALANALWPFYSLDYSTSNGEAALARLLLNVSQFKEDKRESKQVNWVQLYGQEPSLRDKRQ